MSLIICVACFIGSIIWSVKGENMFAVITMVVAGLFAVSWSIDRVSERLKDIYDLNKDKVLAEKTLSAIMAAARKAEDDGK